MAILRLANLHKSYAIGGRSVEALRGIDFELRQGEVVAVMGPSGAGKTTLLTIAGALQRPTSGVVEIAGREVQECSQRELARIRRDKVGFIFQSFNLLQALTARENVQYAVELTGVRGKHARARAQGLLEMLGMGELANQLPKRLSGGEQQRVAAARAFATNADYILADEPTANLDQPRATGLAELLRALSRDLGKPILMVTHDLRIAGFADRLFWLEGGQLTPTEAASIHGLGAPLDREPLTGSPAT